MKNAMRKSEAKGWFGVVPPDRPFDVSRGVDYLYTYLLTFYEDPSRPFGVNNAASPTRHAACAVGTARNAETDL